MAEPKFTCSTCAIAKGAEYFYWFDGNRVASCKACRRAKARSVYAAVREQHIARVRERTKQRRSLGGPEWEASLKSQQEAKRRWRQRNPAAHLLATARARARRRGIAFTISLADITVPRACPVLGAELKPAVTFGTSGNRRHIPTLDRIDGAKGYVPGNVQVISHMANTMKNSATPEELVSFARWILSNYEESQ